MKSILLHLGSVVTILTTVQVLAFASSPSSSSLLQRTSTPVSLVPHQTTKSSSSWRDYPKYHYQKQCPGTTSSSLHLCLAGFPRGGAAAAAAATKKAAETTGPALLLSKLKTWNQSPSSLFNTSLVALALCTAIFKIVQANSNSNDKQQSSSSTKKSNKPDSIITLQRKFLIVFWLLRCADWLQGPYFYEVYASKIFHGIPASMSLISQLFLTGFASTAIFGPWVGRTTDNYGRKKGTLAFSILYALGAMSTKSPLLQILFLGRILSGIGTSLLFSAPESWLVGEAQQSGDDPDGKYLGETFGMVRNFKKKKRKDSFQF